VILIGSGRETTLTELANSLTWAAKQHENVGARIDRETLCGHIMAKFMQVDRCLVNLDHTVVIRADLVEDVGTRCF
jgi:hypothetical protein